MPQPGVAPGTDHAASNDQDDNICVCGKPFATIKAKDCYKGDEVWCDICESDMNNDDIVYHCQNKQHKDDDVDYDFCSNCIVKYASYNPVCICGKKLQKMAAKDAYIDSDGISCSLCDKLFSKLVPIYHCSDGLTKEHDRGYDLCFDCGWKDNKKNNKDKDESSYASSCESSSSSYVCFCGESFETVKAKDCYKDNRVWCDICDSDINNDDIVYHCPNSKHDGGYDLCSNCVVDYTSFNPPCICGKELEKMSAQDAYDNSDGIRCNLCRKSFEKLVPIYHCINGKTKKHDRGSYDLCFDCGWKYNKDESVSSSYESSASSYEAKEKGNLPNVEPSQNKKKDAYDQGNGRTFIKKKKDDPLLDFLKDMAVAVAVTRAILPKRNEPKIPPKIPQRPKIATIAKIKQGLGVIVLKARQHVTYVVHKDFNYYLKLASGSKVTFKSKYGTVINLNYNIWGSGQLLFDPNCQLTKSIIKKIPTQNMIKGLPIHNYFSEGTFTEEITDNAMLLIQNPVLINNQNNINDNDEKKQDLDDEKQIDDDDTTYLLCVLCDNQLWMTIPKIYGPCNQDNIQCNHCYKVLKSTDIMYHCTDCSIRNHIGYDLCDECSMINNSKYNQSMMLTQERTKDDMLICCAYLNLVNNMKIYNEYMSAARNNKCNVNIDQINIQLVLDDFLYLFEAFNDNDECFEAIYNKLGECDAVKCQIFRRNYRNLHDNNCKYQILDTIHCFYQHSYDIGYRNRYSNRLSSKDKTDLNDDNKDDNTYALLNINRQRLYSKYNQLGQTNTYHNGNDDQIDDGMYRFGVSFKYMDDPIDDGDVEVYPKYLKLKEELTQNKVSSIHIIQFNNEYGKAQKHYKSSYRKKYYSGMPIEYILSLMIYCNFDIFQNKFSETYRNNINDHCEFYWLAYNIKNSIHKYGTSINEKTKLYHGICEQLVFPRIIGQKGNGVIIKCPLSTSSQLAAASSFTNNNGLLIEFGYDGASQSLEHGWNRAKYFSVAWLSNFKSESEYLFIQNVSPLNICGIVDAHNGHDYESTLKCLKCIEYITMNCNFDGIRKTGFDRIITMIQNLLSSFDNKAFSEYAIKLINVYCCNKIKFEIDYKYIIKKSSKFWNIFCSSNDDGLKIDVIKKLFPNVTHIRIHNISNMSFCIGTMDNFLTKYHINSKLKLIHLQNDGFRNDRIPSKQKKLINNINYNIFIYENWLKIVRSAIFLFDKYESEYFQITEDGTLVTGINVCSYSIITTTKGFNTGIHKWSIKFIDIGHHHTNPGVISDISKLSLIGRGWHNLVAEKGSLCTGYCYMWHDNDQQLQGYKYGVNINISNKKYKHLRINKNDIVTIILNCNNWKLKFLRNNNICGILDVQPNQTYYPMLYSCACKTQQYKLISAE